MPDKKIYFTLSTFVFILIFLVQGCSDSSSEKTTLSAPPREIRQEQGLAGRLIQFQGEEISGIKIPSLNGDRLDPVKRADGRVVLINIWATWCPPCVQEIPALSRLYLDLKDRGFEAYGVNMKEPAREVEIFRRNFKVEFPVLLDLNGILLEKWGYETLPTTVILDGKGKMRFLAMGYVDWDAPGIRRQIEGLLDELPGREQN
jgi:thiol-disulfide isomerase/thioredoxin